MNIPDFIVEIVANTRQLPKGITRCVQSHVQDEALRELQTIADRNGEKLGRTVYLFAGCYYYAVIEKARA
jgi:hypothetical protein